MLFLLILFSILAGVGTVAGDGYGEAGYYAQAIAVGIRVARVQLQGWGVQQ